LPAILPALGTLLAIGDADAGGAGRVRMIVMDYSIKPEPRPSRSLTPAMTAELGCAARDHQISVLMTMARRQPMPKPATPSGGDA